MSLNIYKYRKDIPNEIEYIRVNDAYFDLYTPLNKDDNFFIKTMKEIEKAKIESPSSFIGRAKGVGPLYSSYISTGTKTILNVYSHPDKCFDVLECGTNVVNYILSNIKNGNIFMEYPVLCLDNENLSCDIVYDKRRFLLLKDFANYLHDSRCNL